MADETLRECPFCGSTDLKVVWVYPSANMNDLRVECGACGAKAGPVPAKNCPKGTKMDRLRGPSRADAAKSWNTRVTDPALAAAQAEVARLRQELADAVDLRRAFAEAADVARQDALTAQRDVAALEGELAALKKPVGQGHDVDAYYKPETCERCRWGQYSQYAKIAWCSNPTGPGEWAGTEEERGCDKWEGEEESR